MLLRAWAFALAALIAGCSAGPEQGAARSAPQIAVVPHRVTLQIQQLRIEAVGTASARRSAVIFAESGGEVTEVNFQAGTRVEPEQLILKLESRQEALAVRRAQVAVQDAEQLLSRYERIDVEGAISDSQIDAAQTALEAARVELEIARNALAERSIVAPFAGYLGLSSIDAGTRITPAMEITRLDDRAMLYVDFEAPEQVFAAINVGDMINMEPFSNPAETYRAEVVAINSSVDAVSRAFTVRAELNNAADQLRPGMSFRVWFTIAGPRYPAIPEAAISWGGDGPYLWLVEEGLAKRQPVSIVARDNGVVLVKADLEQGAVIVAKGVQKVREGTAVRSVLNQGDATLGGQ
ncbi:MAG: efflux RND transporter periplasmic adaptor subunit [Pseudomonadales bacterium]